MNDSAAIPSPDGDRRAVVMSGPVASGLLTPRLRLTPVESSELEELFTLHADPRAFVEDSTAPLDDRAQMRWVLARWVQDWEQHGRGYFSVRARDVAGPSPSLPSGLLGVVGLSLLESDGPPLLSAYWRLDPAAMGRGVAFEAMGAVLADPRCGSHGREVVAVTAARNRPSRSLAARLGFLPAPPQRAVPGGRADDVLLVRPAS
ncbi:GNAT family N-acetyltransferase [uncultured Brachybacterium sp.]|uniref:GNAT family N-acetyltransferase n=1 Tax=uncultured Brachybacterium sp. TaxID=189680 RepID=UPI002620DD32|nr:GNAT family N-acetyltransferase [uncultured Brachybacterium sp.]